MRIKDSVKTKFNISKLRFSDSLTGDERLRSPKGGVHVKGTFYPGGQFIPSSEDQEAAKKAIAAKEQENAKGGTEEKEKTSKTKKPKEENREEEKPINKKPFPAVYETAVKDLYNEIKDRTDRKEFAYIGYGKETKHFAGGDGMVMFEKEDLENADYLIHNHPSAASFSPEDISLFVTVPTMKEMDIISNKGIAYTLKKKSNWKVDPEKIPTLVSDVRRFWIDTKNDLMPKYEPRVIYKGESKDLVWQEHTNEIMQILANKFDFLQYEKIEGPMKFADSLNRITTKDALTKRDGGYLLDERESLEPPYKNRSSAKDRKRINISRFKKRMYDAVVHAPKGGVNVKGKKFIGGQFIPKEGGYQEAFLKMKGKQKTNPSQEKQSEEKGKNINTKTSAPKEIDVKSYSQKAEEISFEQRMQQAEYGDIVARAAANANRVQDKHASNKQIKVQGGVSIENAKAIHANLKNEAETYTKYLATDTGLRLRDFTDSYYSMMKKGMKDGSLKGIDSSKLNSLGIDCIQKLIHQEVESNRQMFTDHGIRHIVGDSQRANAIANILKPNLTGKEALLLNFIAVNHDVGYTVPLIREGGGRSVAVSKDHPKFSEKIAKQQSSLWNENNIFTKEEYDQALKIISTHDSTELDKHDVLGTSMRLADNLSLFGSEKLPSAFRYVQGGSDVLVGMGIAARDNDTKKFEQLKVELHKKISAANMNANLKRDLMSATNEISFLTPKFTMGVLAGEIDNIKNEKGKLDITIKYDKYDHFLQKMFDMGQKQAKKLLGDYGHTEYNKPSYDLGEFVRLNVIKNTNEKDGAIMDNNASKTKDFYTKNRNTRFKIKGDKLPVGLKKKVKDSIKSRFNFKKTKDYMSPGADKEERAKQKVILQGKYSDYNPVRHDVFVQRFNKEEQNATEKQYRVNRGLDSKTKDEDNIKSKIIAFFKANPNPDDEKIHAFAEEQGINPHELETNIYALLSERLTNDTKDDLAVWKKGSIVVLEKDDSKGKFYQVYNTKTGKQIGSDYNDERQAIAQACKEVGTNDAEPFKKADIPDDQFDKDQLAMGIEVEKEHTDDPEIAKAISKAHLSELPDYYTRLAKMESEAKAIEAKDDWSPEAREAALEARRGNKKPLEKHIKNLQEKVSAGQERKNDIDKRLAEIAANKIAYKKRLAELKGRS